MTRLGTASTAHRQGEQFVCSTIPDPAAIDLAAGPQSDRYRHPWPACLLALWSVLRPSRHHGVGAGLNASLAACLSDLAGSLSGTQSFKRFLETAWVRECAFFLPVPCRANFGVAETLWLLKADKSMGRDKTGDRRFYHDGNHSSLLGYARNTYF
jgi:hypothetical protein